MPDGNRSRWTHARAPELNPWREQDACGVGFVARASGERSSEITRLALQALARVAHRGAAATDSSGDGAGVLTQIPHRLFAREAPRHGIALAPDGSPPFAVGAFFLPRDPGARSSPRPPTAAGPMTPPGSARSTARAAPSSAASPTPDRDSRRSSCAPY